MDDLKDIKFDHMGLVPAIVQEADTKEVLMLAYMNAESIRMTLESGYAHFWSRSREMYWKKGETSGCLQELRELLYDCDGDTLLVRVKQLGRGACHTGERTCFFRKLEQTD